MSDWKHHEYMVARGGDGRTNPYMRSVVCSRCHCADPRPDPKRSSDCLCGHPIIPTPPTAPDGAP